MAKEVREIVEVAHRKLSVSNRDKVLWPADGYTKGDLIDYYRGVARYLVPHLRDRPLTLERFPNGIDGESFFEKQVPRGAPEWVNTVRVPSHAEHRSHIEYIVCNDEPTLVYCANLAAIVLHAWTSRVQSLDNPDFALFDLDPWEGCTLKTLATVALRLRDALSEIGMSPLVKTSGATGMHVVVPLDPVYDYEPIKQFAEIVSRHVALLLPEQTTLQRMTAARSPKTVYLDYVQVGKGKTIVPPFVVRARPKAPVSMTLAWEEVEEFAASRTQNPTTAFSRWTIKNALRRIEKDGDLWAGRHWRPARLEPALKRARTLWGN